MSIVSSDITVNRSGLAAIHNASVWGKRVQSVSTPTCENRRSCRVPQDSDRETLFAS